MDAQDIEAEYTNGCTLARRLRSPSRLPGVYHSTRTCSRESGRYRVPDPDISVIIPVYNAGEYVQRSVISVIEQTLPAARIEIIAIDDGSTDGSGVELDQLAAEHESLCVIHQENSGGASRPRNVGLDRARGRWIFFLDADDHLAPEALERMLAMAEEQGSDVLLGRVIGTGGRPSPKTMFRSDQLNADLFESNVYRTLNVLKLFRRDLIERLGLRFDEDMRCGEDLPFTATAYLNASVISVLASYECIYWHYREDGQNNFLVQRDLEQRTAAAEVMLALIAENVETGPGRNHLMSRHFEIEVLIGLQCLLGEPSRKKQFEALRRVQSWLDSHYNDDIEARLPVFNRVCFSLVRQGLLDELLELLEYQAAGDKPDSIVDNGRVFVGYPFFRDSRGDVSDSCFEVTDRVKIIRCLDAAAWSGSVLRIEAYARLTRVGESTPEATLLLRHRTSGDEWTVETTTVPAEGDLSGVYMSGDIDLRTAAGGGALAPGLWDVFVVLEDRGLVREGRLGSTRAESVVTTERPRAITLDDEHTVIVVSYYTDPYSNLTIDVGDTRRSVGEPLSVQDVAWNGATLVICGSCALLNLPRGAVGVVLSSPEATHRVECELAEGGEGTEFVARVVLKRASGGRPLTAGVYELAVALSLGDVQERLPVPVLGKLPTVRWWRYGIPYHARCSRDDAKPMGLRISRVRLGRAIARRIRG